MLMCGRNQHNKNVKKVRKNIKDKKLLFIEPNWWGETIMESSGDIMM